MWVTKVKKMSAILATIFVLGFGGTGLAYRMQATAQASGMAGNALPPHEDTALPKAERRGGDVADPEVDLQKARQQLEELLRKLRREEEARLAEELKKQEQVRAAATIQRELEKALETVRKANDKKSEIEILEELEKVIKEMKRKAQGQVEEKKPEKSPGR
ncbi:hypothetical protein AYO40_00855 [Planctomycetaceae bacterium SCGC AG-212-D15]|nr:hypothetical protein AYO40_00855 [Planctomycetaceae bacterium SCGC AG-212-D15]